MGHPICSMEFDLYLLIVVQRIFVESVWKWNFVSFSINILLLCVFFYPFSRRFGSFPCSFLEEWSIIDSSISKITHHFEDINLRDLAAVNFQSRNGRHVKYFKMKSCRQSLRHLASDTNDTLPDIQFNCHCVTFHTWSLFKTSSFVLSALTIARSMCDCDMGQTSFHFDWFQNSVQFTDKVSKPSFFPSIHNRLKGRSAHRTPACRHNYHDAEIRMRLCISEFVIRSNIWICVLYAIMASIYLCWVPAAGVR